MGNVKILVGSIITSLLVVVVHGIVQFVFTKETSSFFEARKILLFFIVFISCFVLSKQEMKNE
ncbi:hypothetical protein [Sporosarcina sp. Te-1]|uniref:hypothetical protein n=1 Tax=Sporosarcina sp. Te-1 TaxID=2818390 RepID=UPI001A9E8B53|nr:hypothetical protein [Sporosarcina sp. Te-1]QTD40072.1 hypothetical protein J3U78_14750 [Sporosarcina sp. Te-1]